MSGDNCIDCFITRLQVLSKLKLIPGNRGFDRNISKMLGLGDRGDDCPAYSAPDNREATIKLLQQRRKELIQIHAKNTNTQARHSDA